MSIEQRLLNLKEKIETAKSEKSRAEGALAQLMARLKEEFSVNTEEEGEALLQKLQEQAKDLAEKVDAQVDKMEDTYGL